MKNNKNIADVSLEEYKIEDNKIIAEGVYVLSVERRFDFVPGQVVHVTTSKIIPPRMYSICSGKDEKLLKILYNIKPDGVLTNQLANLKSGDKLLMSEASGSFYPKIKDSWWVASGTGIAPFISQALSENLNNVTVVHGSRFMEGFYFSDLFKNKLGVEYIRCCSSESSPQVYSGRLTNYLKEYESLPSDQMFFLCGSTEMVVDTRDLLINKGIEFSKIASEIYF